MSGRDKYPKWLLWVLEGGPWLVFACLSLLLFTLCAFAFYLDSRLSGIESRLAYAPARNYSPPDPADYPPGDINADQLPTQRWVYVPVHSHVYYNGGLPLALETLLSIRNTDSDEEIYLDAVEYYDTDGALIKTHLDTLIRLKPMQTIDFLVERQDSSGGSGANFLVHWLSNEEAETPMIEAVMIGASGSHGVSLRVQGVDSVRRTSE